MQRQNYGKLGRLVDFLELPKDIVMDLPRITLLGNQQLLVENHKGVIEYTPSLVRVKLSQGILVVKGKELQLGNLQPEQILLEGTVEAIEYEI